MWSGTLDSDIVKWFVGLGTELVKIVDTIGLIPSVLAAILTYKLAIGATKLFHLGDLMTYIGLMWTAKDVTELQGWALDKINIKQALMNSTLVKAQAARMGLTAAELAGYSVTQLLGLGIKGLIAGFKNLWIAMGPVGWAIIGITVALTAGIAIFNAVHKTTAELKEELDDMKSSLSDIRSELDSVNSELKTTQERMAELLAMDTLTFEEQEELDKLRKTNDELERRKELLKDQEELDKARVGRQAARVVDSASNDKDWWETALMAYTAIAPAGLATAPIGTFARTEGQEVQKNISDYVNLKNRFDNASTLKEQEKYQKKLDKEAEKIDAYILELSEALDGVEYGDSEESDAALDYLAELESKYAIARGSKNAKSSAVKGVFAKKEFAETKEAIDEYVDALAKGDASAATHIDEIINKNTDLVEDLEARGVKAQDAVDYFTKLGSEANYATIDGKIKEIDRASATFESLINGNTFKVDGIDIGLAELFDEEGKVIQTTLSQIFNDTSDQTREDITSLLEGSYDQIKNSTVDTERLLTGFGLKATQQVIGIQNKLLGEQNIELFPNLKDEINGIIDTFAEFSKAVGGVVDALDTLEKARIEEAYSGSISIETLENLMKYTDDYAQLVEIDETGAIRLAADAEGILIKQRLEKIKTDAAAAVQTAQANLAQAEYNAKAVNETGPVQEALTAATDGLAGAWAYLGSMIGDIKDGNFSGMFERASTAYGKVTAGREEKRAQVNVSVEDAEKALDKALDQQKIANALTPDNVKTKYSSEEASGGNATKEDAALDAFQKAMDYWENRIKANQARYEQLQNEIDLLESRGKIVGKEYYAEQVKIEKERLDLLVKQRAEAKSYLNNFTEGSDEWWEIAHTLNDLEGEIDGVTSSVEDLSEAMRNVDVQIFEEIVDRFSQLSDELSNIRDILSSEDMFDEEGNWTKAGIAVLGTHLQDIEMYKKGLSEVEEELNYLLNGGGEDDYSGNEQAYYDRVKELTNQQHEYVKAIHDSEQSVVDMYESNVDAVEEYTDKLVESYQDYIDNVKEALDSERDLYEFKKNIKKQTKDIATLERRIASLSGSTNAGDIAERRRLEADLYGAREELDDTYYDHAKQTQQDALDAEAEAYEETMTRFVEGMRTSLAEATVNMDSFLNSVTIAASMNADAVLEKYEETGLKLSPELTNPWVAAKNAIGEYGQEAIDLMNKWTQDGYWTDFTAKVGSELSSPWSAGADAASAFESSVGTVMTNVVSEIERNVQSASTKLSNLYQQILDTKEKAQNVNVGGDEPSQTPTSTPTRTPISNATPTATTPKITSTTIRPASPTRPTFKKVGDSWSGVGSTGVSVGKKTYNKALEEEGGDGIYYPYTNGNGYKGYIKKGEGYTVLGNGKMDVHSLKPLYAKQRVSGGGKFAHGTIGTTKDQWAITDEPQFGDELILVPGKDGNLSFMRKGTGVVPADLTANLMEWGKFDPSSMNLGGGVNVNMINNAVNKPEFNLSVENFLKCDNVSQDSLPELKQFVKEQMNSLVKQMNYSLKKSGAR